MGIRIGVILLVLSAWANSMLAQKTAIDYSEYYDYNEALNFFEKEKFASALQNFEATILSISDPHQEVRVNAEYYRGVCALYLQHKDAEFLLERFTIEHPDSPWVQKIYIQIGDYNFKKRKYKKATYWYKKVKEHKLKGQEEIAYKYKRAYSYFYVNNYTKAKPGFFEIKDLDSEYKDAATYYYSHIAYEEANYQTALDGFSILTNSPSFEPITPYYIAQIYFLQEKHDLVLEFAPPLIDGDQVSVERVPEIARIVGESYFVKDQFDEALPYLELYHKETPEKHKVRADYYQLGYVYYRNKSYEKALELFSEVTDEEDEMSQLANYHMADCYLKLDQKPYARSAFKQAFEMDFDAEIKEDALFNYAKLAFELSYNPFHEAIVAFEGYIEDYPESERSEEAYEFLLNVYMKSKNYEAALKSLDKISNKDQRTKEAYQVVTFNRAVELFNQKKYDESATYFNKVNTYSVNQDLIAEAIYWKAELAYKQGDYQRAATMFTDFLLEPGGFNSDWYDDAYYNAGYSYFKQKNYGQALSMFRKFSDNYSGDDSRKLNDAYLRIGDCFYVDKKYTQAIDFYNRAISLNELGSDYAMYQKAICQGLSGDTDSKISTLNRIINSDSKGRYVLDSKFEIAETYRIIDNDSKALETYLGIIETNPSSQYAKRSLKNIVFLHRRQGNNTEALAAFDKIVEKYSSDKVMNEALQLVKDIYIQERGLSAYNLLVTGNPILDITTASIDSTAYQVALDSYFDMSYSKAKDSFEEYIGQFAPGLFSVEAHYYLAEIYFEEGAKSKALANYNFVITQPVSEYSEGSLKTAATINFNNKYYDAALNNYIELEGVAVQKMNLLEAEIGQMRCYYELMRFDYALDYAQRVLDNGDTPVEIKNQAYMIRGKIRYDKGNYDEAYYDFKEVQKAVSLLGAEAKYYMAQIAFDKGAYKNCEKEVFELIENFSAYSKYKFEGFLLLVEAYVALEDIFQAKATLNALIGNANEDWVKERSRARLAELEAIEKAALEQGEDNDVEIELFDEE